MTTVTPPPTSIGRQKEYAASSDWTDRASCHGTDSEAFFGDTKDDREAARRVCVDCPVILECLGEHMALDDVMYRFGIGGGLSGDQRRALECELLLGMVPNWVMARRLVTPGARPYLVHIFRESGRLLDDTVTALRRLGLLVDPVTVRVALWWVGESVPRMRPAADGDGRTAVERIADDHADVVRRLRAAGASFRDVASFLGARIETTTAAVKTLETQGVRAA